MDIFDTAGRRQRLMDAFGVNPDKAAEQIRIGRDMGVLPAMVDDRARSLHKLDGLDRKMDGLSVLPRAIADKPAFADLAHDDIDRLAAIETIARDMRQNKAREEARKQPGFMSGTLSEIGLNLKKIPAAMAQNRNDQQIENLRYTVQLLQDQGSLTPEMQTYYEQQIALYGGQFEEAKAEVAKINADIHALRPKDMHWAQKIIRGAVTSAPNTLAALGITLATRNPSAGALALGATVSETSTADARLEGLSFDEAQRKGMIDGAAETLFEVMPLGRMMALYRRGGGDVTQSALKELGKATVSDMLGENATQFVQDMNNVMHGLDQELQDAIDKHGFFSPEVLKIQGERQLIATGTSALMSGAMGSPAVVMDALNNRERMAGDIAKNMQQEQEQGLQNLADISKAVQDSKLRERAPEIFADLAHDIAANADHPHLYLDANALHQSGLMDVIADAVPDLAAPMQEAAEAGGAVQIPLADYLAKIAPDANLVASLSEHVRFEPEGLSLAEITRNAAAELDADIAARAQELAEAQALDAEVQTVKQNILDQLNAVGRFTPEANDKQATLAAAAYETWAARLHTTPQELFARHPLHIVGESAEGGFAQPVTQDFHWEYGQRRGLFGHADIPIAEVTGQELGVDEKSIRQNSAAKLKNYAAGGLVNRDTGWDLRIGKKGIDKLVWWNGVNIQSLQSHAVIESLVENAVLAESHHDAKRNNPDIRGIHRLYAPIRIDGKVYRAKLTVRDYQGNAGEKTNLHALESVEIENAPMGTFQSPQNAETGQPTSERLEISIADLLSGSKREDGTDWDLSDKLLYQNPASPRGKFIPDSNTIVLLENADLSTFQHELGHFFLETMVGFANDLRHIDTLSGGGTLSETEKQMLRDVDILMDWFGLDLETWNRMTLAEKRPYHEKQARGFERFIMEGKAPSLELEGVFARMLTWFLHLYKKLTALDVELSDEVRQVYGRMLASDEAIQLAEQNRSMRQMFASAEEAGMTVEAFAAYQQEGEGARSAALDEMRARVIRDAKYFGNAKNRALKAKQKEAREIRAELTMEARAMVMREPVYRAWSILTARMNADTTIAEDKRPWTAELDPARDSLFVAIAKLGGLDAAQAKSEWGFEDKIARPHPHHPVLRKSGGHSLDDMAGMLAEQGYLPPDYDLKDLGSRFAAEFAGNAQYSSHYQPGTGGAPVVGDLAALRLDHDSLIDLGYTPEQIAALGRKVRKKGGVHPDLLAEVLPDAEGNPVYDSGDALVQDLLAARPPQEAIRELTDQMMLERFGELSSPEAIAEAADMAAHNDIRLRAIATDAAILAKAVGGQRVLASAAKAVAQQTIANKKLKDIRPHQFTRMETRAAKAAEQARKKGDIETAAAEKRNQVLQASLARAAWEAQEEAAKIVRYLKRMEKLNPQVIAMEYREQIEGILERYNLRTQSGKALTRTQSLVEWVEKQREQGIEPDLPAHVLDEMQRTPWQNLTIAELRGLSDSIAQIEHLGRLKNKLLAHRKQQDYDAVISNMVGSIVSNATKSGIENRTPTTRGDKMKASVKRFLASHRKVAMIARMMDGETDGGAVTENLITTANRAADFETEWRGQASEKLTEILAPLIGRKDLNKKQSFVIAGKVRSFTHQDIFGMALNWGNEGNRQRLLDGEKWTEADIQPLLARLSKAEWLAVQQVWDYIGSFKDDIAAKERRVYGKEPDWVEASPFTVTTADGETITLDGGYYPIKYDTRASETAAQQEEAELAKRQMYGAHTAATTKRSFTKTRVAEVHDRPLRYDLAGVYQGLNDVIHDLAWHEWLIDTNKLLRSKRLTDAIRDHYGADTLDQIKNWVKDIAEGDTQADRKSIEALHTIRKYASVAGLGFNVISALKQPLGLMQSVARVGGSEVLASLGQFVAHPVRMTKEARAESSFMRNRAKTRFRELNEVRNALEQKNRVQQVISDYSYILIMAVQQCVDVITWHAQRNKSLAAGASFADANAHADQAVRDSQGSGMVHDLSAIERGNISRLFTVYYGFMNTVYNLEANALAAQKNSMGQKAATILMLAVVMPILDAALSDLLPPGDSGEWDEDDWAKSAGKAVANSLTGHFFALREIQFSGYGYQGPVGLRSIADAHKLIEQAGQGEFDRGFRKALINTAGSWIGLPAAQINRTWDGAEALADDDTDNPAVLLFGHQQPR